MKYPEDAGPPLLRANVDQMSRFLLHRFAVLFVLSLVTVTGLCAQEEPASGEADSEFPPLSLPADFGDLGGPEGIGGFTANDGEEIQLTGSLKAAKDSRDGVLEIKAVMAPKWHTYAVDQQGGPGPTKLKVDAKGALEVTAPFRPDQAPHVRPPDLFDVPLREHYESVTWTAPVRFAEDAKPDEVELDVKFEGQVCHDERGCIPISNRPVPVEFAGYYEVQSPAGEYRAERSHATIRGHIEPATAAPGSTVKLVLTAEMDEGFHVYTYSPRDVDAGAFKHTLIAVSEPAEWQVGAPSTPAEPISKKVLPNEPEIQYFDGSVTWTTELQVPADIEPSSTVDIAGGIAYQTCEEAACDRPTGATFSVRLNIGEADNAEKRPLSFAKASYGAVAKLAEARHADQTTEPAEPAKLDFTNLKPESSLRGNASLLFMLPTALLAGFILNFMPCVLPVIGLKVMSFVQQAGENRSRVFVLNLWYSAGILFVFMVLATLVVGVGMKWGAQFNNAAFNVVLTGIVFAFALSFLGIWEIPVPGFASGSKANDLAAKEGPSGAFFKGVLTTILATPCSGPLLVPAMAWAVKQPAAIAYSSFAFVGLGMAFPFLVIGLFPKLVGFLPKPGAWMDTFKHIMGFVLLGTVVLLLTFIPMYYVVPVVAMLMGLWAMLWWVGQVPLYEALGKQLRAWAEGGIFAAIVVMVSFGWLLGVMEGRFEETVEFEIAQRQPAGESTEVSVAQSKKKAHELPWKPYSLELLQREISENKTVFVDFTSPT